MRLLNTTTLELREFFGSEIPFYAILSHRWGDGEVTFQDLKSERRFDMAGWGKITGCCSQAENDGWEYAWIDSCCIDKSSSAELSEAINSMFQWYKNAQVCYAYLSDVPDTEKDHEKEGSAFRNSTWWTRGWTLQELLAPETIVFFNCSWTDIGTKSSCYKLISAITDIDAKFLWDYDRASIAQKMSWSSSRETLRLEDVAYSLMGLFGVHMPLLYGEGGQAFMRLQLEIMKISDDESLFAWADTSIPPHGGSILATSPVAFRRSKHFERYDWSGPNWSLNHRPYLMTNKGLQIALPLKKIEWTPPPQPRGHIGPPPNARFLYYIALLKCHTKSQKETVAIKLRENVDYERERYCRIDCNILDYVTIDRKPSKLSEIGYNERTIFVRPQILSTDLTYEDFFAIEVHTGTLLDTGFVVHTGWNTYLDRAKPGDAINAREWTFSLDRHDAKWIAVEGPRASFVLEIGRWGLPSKHFLSTDLLKSKGSIVGSDRPTQRLTFSSYKGRCDRATLILPCGDTVYVTLKKTPRGTEIVYILDFDYVLR